MTLRDVKKDRTRAAIVAAAERLFRERGYDGTTVAQIAADADVGTRTFFRYFASKEDTLFPDVELRIATAVDTLKNRGRDESPAAALLRSLDVAGLTGPGDPASLDALRLQLLREVPSVAGRAILLQRRAEQQISRALLEAYPGRFDELSASALVGAFVGAFTSASDAAQADGSHSSREDIRAAVARALGL
ncbi:MAG: TetR family transcriptional regulator [Leifsonia sp.]